MNYKIFFYNYITEGKREIKKILLSFSLSEDIIDKIIKMDQSVSKQDSIRLARYYKEIADLGIIENYYKKFIKLKKKRQASDINLYKTWHDFENFIDSKETIVDLSIKGNESKEKDEAIYKDDVMEVYHADTMDKAIRYSHNLGQEYSFCIGRKSGGNLFNSYRLRNESNFFFIKFLNKSNDIENGKFVDPSHMLVLDIGKRIMITKSDNGKQGGGTKVIDIKTLFGEFPELEKISHLFVSRPLTEEEKNKLEKMIDVSERRKDFLELKHNERVEYIQSGYNIHYDYMLDLFDLPMWNAFSGTGYQIGYKDYIEKMPDKCKERWRKTRTLYLKGILDTQRYLFVDITNSVDIDFIFIQNDDFSEYMPILDFNYMNILSIMEKELTTEELYKKRLEFFILNTDEHYVLLSKGIINRIRDPLSGEVDLSEECIDIILRKDISKIQMEYGNGRIDSNFPLLINHNLLSREKIFEVLKDYKNFRTILLSFSFYDYGEGLRKMYDVLEKESDYFTKDKSDIINCGFLYTFYKYLWRKEKYKVLLKYISFVRNNEIWFDLHKYNFPLSSKITLLKFKKIIERMYPNKNIYVYIDSENGEALKPFDDYITTKFNN